jgi:hypothetical protein
VNFLERTRFCVSGLCVSETADGQKAVPSIVTRLAQKQRFWVQLTVKSNPDLIFDDGA